MEMTCVGRDVLVTPKQSILQSIHLFHACQIFMNFFTFEKSNDSDFVFGQNDSDSKYLKLSKYTEIDI